MGGLISIIVIIFAIRIFVKYAKKYYNDLPNTGFADQIKDQGILNIIDANTNKSTGKRYPEPKDPNKSLDYSQKMDYTDFSEVKSKNIYNKSAEKNKDSDIQVIDSSNLEPQNQMQTMYQKNKTEFDLWKKDFDEDIQKYLNVNEYMQRFKE